jgi:hypothetical protein
VQATIADGEATYTPSADLAPGKHVASVQLSDVAGRTATQTWSFTVPGSEAGAGGGFPVALAAVAVLVVLGAAGAVLWMRSKKAKP